MDGCGWIDIRVCWSDSAWVVASSDEPASKNVWERGFVLKLGGGTDMLDWRIPRVVSGYEHDWTVLVFHRQCSRLAMNGIL